MNDSNVNLKENQKQIDDFLSLKNKSFLFWLNYSRIFVLDPRRLTETFSCLFVVLIHVVFVLFSPIVIPVMAVVYKKVYLKNLKKYKKEVQTQNKKDIV
jgi:hypothetical protein